MYFKSIKYNHKSRHQRLAVHAAEQPALKPNARRHGSKPNDGSNKIKRFFEYFCGKIKDDRK